MQALRSSPPRNTGPIEVRDHGPSGRRLGNIDDCYDGSPWELHRGELVQQLGSKDIHGILMALITALFRTHARRGITVMTDVYCDLSDPDSPSLRAPDIALVSGLERPRDDVFRGVPIVAVEVRGTQSKRYLDEKVKLYLEHGWPCTWLVHAHRSEVEVVTPGSAPVIYRPGSEVPLVPELSAYDLAAVPVTALFDEIELARYNDGWVQARARAAAILDFLAARGIELPEEHHTRVAATRDPALLTAWLTAAATAPDAATFIHALAASSPAA